MSSGKFPCISGDTAFTVLYFSGHSWPESACVFWFIRSMNSATCRTISVGKDFLSGESTGTSCDIPLWTPSQNISENVRPFFPNPVEQYAGSLKTVSLIIIALFAGICWLAKLQLDESKILDFNNKFLC